MTTTSIPFSQIPADLEVPGAFAEFNASNAANGASPLAYRYLIIGQMLPTGSAQPLVPQLITTGKAQADGLFGQGSMLSNMVAGAVAANTMVETWAIGTLDNTAGVAAQGAITFTGTATQAATLTAYIAYSGLIMPAQVSVSVGETAAQVASALAAAITETLDLPVTAAVDGTTPGKVDITARHKGVDAGVIDIRLQYEQGDVIPAGLTAVVTAMSGGAGNPSMTPVIAALGDKQYHVMAMPYTDGASYSAWYTEMMRRWNALIGAEGALVTAMRGTPGSINTALAAMNSQFQDMWASQNTPTAPFVEAAIIGAVYCANLVNRPNAPQRGTLLPNMKGPALADQFTLAERQLQYLEGGSCWTVGDDGSVALERAVTTYKTNAAGTADSSYHGRWVMATLMYLRPSWVNWMAVRFPNFTLADNGTPVVSGETTPAGLAHETLAWYQAMMGLGLVQDFAGFKAALLSIRNAQNHARNDQLLSPRLVGPLEIIAGQMAFEE